MKVICLEGVHGVGKSTLIETFKSEGFETMDECYLFSQESLMHPQGMYFELDWVLRWFKNILEHVEKKTRVLITDRSAFSAHFYVHEKYKNALLTITRHLWEEIQQTVDVTFETIYVYASIDDIWARILIRAKDDPHREEELSMDFLKRIYKEYSEFKWDKKVEHATTTKIKACF